MWGVSCEFKNNFPRRFRNSAETSLFSCLVLKKIIACLNQFSVGRHENLRKTRIRKNPVLGKIPWKTCFFQKTKLVICAKFREKHVFFNKNFFYFLLYFWKKKNNTKKNLIHFFHNHATSMLSRFVHFRSPPPPEFCFGKDLPCFLSKNLKIAKKKKFEEINFEFFGAGYAFLDFVLNFRDEIIKFYMTILVRPSRVGGRTARKFLVLRKSLRSVLRKIGSTYCLISPKIWEICIVIPPVA